MEATPSTSTEQTSNRNEIEVIENQQEGNGVHLVIKYDCSICSETYDNGQIMALKCGHTFHCKCLTEWFQTKTTCPKCSQKTSMENALTVFLDKKIHDGTNSMEPIAMNETAPKFWITPMKDTLKKTKKKIQDRFLTALCYILLLEIIFYSVGAICATIIDGYISDAFSITYKNVIQSRYSKELELYVERNLSDVKYDMHNNTVRDKYLNEKGYKRSWMSEYAVGRGGLYGTLLGLIGLFIFILFKIAKNPQYFGKIRRHKDSENVAQFESLIKELERVYDPVYIVSQICVGLGLIYLIIIGFVSPFYLNYKKHLRADYALLIDKNFKLYELIIGHNHDVKHIKSIDDLRKEYFKEMEANEADTVYLNTCMFIFTGVGAFIITALCSFVVALSVFKYVVLSKKLKRIAQNSEA